MLKTSDCNNCDNRSCKKSFKLKRHETNYRSCFVQTRVGDYPYRPTVSSGIKQPMQCYNQIVPKSSFKLAEVACAHLQSLVYSLNTLPFKITLDKYLK